MINFFNSRYLTSMSNENKVGNANKNIINDEISTMHK